MKEYGSDFHYIDSFRKESSELSLLGMINDAVYYADGRQAIQELIRHNTWDHIWMPVYFCYEITEAIKQTGIKVSYYNDYPAGQDKEAITKIDFTEGDVLFRVNYFGLRGFRTNKDISVPVIEDHSHDLIGEWACRSDADWCIASLRKTLPIPEGGVLWSPKGHSLPPQPDSCTENDLLSSMRMNAMMLKKIYLEGGNSEKSYFRNIFIETEESLEALPVSGIAPDNIYIIDNFDLRKWNDIKNSNWAILENMVDSMHVKALRPENEGCNPFSFVLWFENLEDAEKMRSHLIKNNIYPATLWESPVDSPFYNQTALSVHCDGRYNKKDMLHICNIINQITI